MAHLKNSPLWKRAAFAFAGIWEACKTEKSFRLQLIAGAGVAALLGVTKPAPVWWAIGLMMSGVLIAAELMNTAIEKLADHLHPELHEAVKVVKDTAAGAVLVLSLVAGAVFVAFLLGM